MSTTVLMVDSSAGPEWVSDSTALANLNAFSISGGTLTGYLAPAVTSLTDGSSVALNAALGNIFTWALAGSSHTLSAPSNPVNGQIITIDIAYSGSYTPLFNSVFDFGNNGQPQWSATSGNTDTVSFRYSSLKSAWLYQGSVLGL
jgi:hypothetical protein